MGFYFINITGWKSFLIKGDKYQFKELYLKKLSEELRFSGINNVEKKSGKIFFRAPLFRFIWNGWNRFNPVSNGVFIFRNIENFGIVEYRLWFWEFFIISLLFSIIPFVGFFPNLFWRIICLSIIWIIYLINILLAVHRIENYLGKLAPEINELINRSLIE